MSSPQNRLARSFFERYTPDVARDLLGKLIVRRIDGVSLVGRIVETEAYRGFRDPASHAFKGKTSRNSVMFSRGGLAYVYFIYGSSFCLNATSEQEGKPGAVLIRALEPLSGIEEMMKNRGVEDAQELTNGPGKLTRALMIDSTLNGEDLVTSKRLYILNQQTPLSVGTSARIGVSKAKERHWRFYVQGNSFVSKRNA